MLACYCLNILIEAANDFQKVTAETLGLNDEEKSDKFFKQDIQKVEKLLNITKVHPCLVQTRHVGCWTITRCCNCDCYTHAVHREKGASCVLIYTKLLNIDLPRTVENTIKNIRHAMSEHLRKESLAAEEKIRQYTEEQYELLNVVRDRAFKEQESLVR
ncbi:hypothetical protein NQ314_015290 [Rhamnusium bicolor]|uniref:Uncharacterized protein n=1 Tax=Rhamnusium bicolor TaxID=1586634 RepID=A0AAV8WZ94_9CUCU|nr:hypothetical protein NQ314_015290 [Rhamnusium bicolor]